MWLFLLWWTFDDHLAEALEAPGVGELPIWVMALASIALSMTLSVNGARSGKGK